MHKLSKTLAMRTKLFMTVVALTTLSIPIAFSPADAKPVQSQPAATNLSDFKFEVVSIKPAKNPNGGWALNPTDDGVRGLNVPLEYLIHQAYGIHEDYRYSGAPNWIKSENYDVEAKMESSVADAFRKLPRAQQEVALEHMLQVVLAERFNLKVHRETKELPVYFLVVARGGPKLQESKPNPDDPNAPRNASWGGTVRGPLTISTAKLMPIEDLASELSRSVGRMVLDKTGLTGKYDFTLQYVREQIAVTPSADTSDSSDTSIFRALQDQLGLKLESGKGPVEIIVIDHVERASGN
jgi:uncharacterized protein (TIGR03435 family)